MEFQLLNNMMVFEMPYMDYLSCSFFITGCLLWKFSPWRSPSDPLCKIPGPKGWPIIGNLFQLKTPLHKTFTDWARTHGPVFRVVIPGRTRLVVSGVKEIQEVLQEKSSHFDPQRNAWVMDSFRQNGIMNVFFSLNSDNQKKLKNLTKSSIQGRWNAEEYQESVHSTLGKMCQTIHANQQTQTDPWPIITNTLNDLSFYMVFGRSPSDLEKDEALQMAAETNAIFTFRYRHALFNFKFLRKIPTEMHQLAKQMTWRVTTWFHNRVIQCSESKRNSVIYHMWQKRTSEGNEKIDLPVLDMTSTAMTIIEGAQLSLASAVYNCIAILAEHRQIQENLQEKIHQCIGNRSPLTSDRQYLPHVESFLMEMLRYTDTIPVLDVRKTLDDTTIGGYDIPRGTTLVVNLWGVLHDPDVWGDPWTIRPDRFLDLQGNLIPSNHPLRKSWLPFGAGSRSCMGQKLAEDVLFMLIVTILQEYTVHPGTDSGRAADPNNYMDSGIHRAKPYTVIFEPRVTDK